MCRLIKKIVLKKDTIFVEREREDLIALFGVFVGLKKENYRKDVEEMAKTIYFADQNVLNNEFDELECDDVSYSESEDENEDIEGFHQYVKELTEHTGRAHLFDNGHMYRIKFTNRKKENEMNLMDYYKIQDELVIKRTRVEIGIQIMRKYK